MRRAPEIPLGETGWWAMSCDLALRTMGVRETGGDGMKDTSRLICPLCEVHQLQPYGRDSTLCPHCGRFSGVFLRTLREISALPDAIGAHACECGHPEMRRLPDGVYRCPACGLEVLPISPPRPGRSRHP